jgi:hypothetical protein
MPHASDTSRRDGALITLAGVTAVVIVCCITFLTWSGDVPSEVSVPVLSTIASGVAIGAISRLSGFGGGGSGSGS